MNIKQVHVAINEVAENDVAGEPTAEGESRDDSEDDLLTSHFIKAAWFLQQ